MASRVTRVLTFVTVLWISVALPRSTVALSVEDLYPFGPALSNSVLPQDIDVSSPEVLLETEIKYFEETYKSIFVNSNGVLSFLARFPEFANIEFPLMYPMIAPFYSYIDTRQAGAIYYNETKDDKVLRRATDIVRQSFSSAYDFQAKSVFIATWDNVGYNPKGADKQNTFQVAISSDGNSSYAEFLYPDNGIQWVQGSSKKDALPDARAQVGIIARDGRMHVIRGSGSDQVRNIVRRTNCGAPGHWLFRIGPLSYGAVEEPDTNPGALPAPWQETCDKDSSICHSLAHCAPTPFNDSCCECDRGQIGNGLSCISEVAPLRVTGSVTGKLNNINITELDIQTYAMISDGRIYTALTRVPKELGNELQLITAFVNSVGWLFGKRDADAPNGFSLTGGTVNHTCDIFFPRSGHRVTIMIKYTGLDIFDQLALNVKVVGEVPSIGSVQELTFPDHDEVFLEGIPGVLQSSSRQVFHVTQGDPGTPFTVEQRIEFDVCGNRPLLGSSHQSAPATLRLECAQTTVSYEPEDDLLRFSAIYKTLSKLASTDPCATAVCGPHSVCVSSDNDFECQCLPGYTIHQGEEECSDVDECERGRSVCSPLAHCENTLGSYRCTCPPGYSGDGTICEKDYICEDHGCQEYARCVNNQCQCYTGHIALGSVCVLNNTGEIQDRNPGKYSDCATDPLNNIEDCVCTAGYTGDGYDCYPIDEAGASQPTPETDPYRGTCYEYQDCHPDAICDYSSQIGNYACKCKEGFNGDGRVACNPDKRGCNVLHNCHRDAECVNVDIFTRKFECRCRHGFAGDGKQSCVRNAPPDCSELKNCGHNAECIHVHGAKGYRCTCKEGYVGDGFSCKPERRHEKTRCGPQGSRQCRETGSDFLLVNQGVATLKVPLLPGTGLQGIPIHIGDMKVAIGIDVDCQEERVYWGDVLGNAIKSSYYNGTNETTFLNIDIGSPEGVSIDWVSRNIYWTDSVKKRIEVASLEHKERRILADYGLENPRGIAVHPQRGKVFWSDWNRITPKLEWANLDGTQREVFLQGEAVVLPNSIAIDFERDELCWADAGTKSIECINLEHSERRTIATNCSHPFGLTLSPDNYFWTDWASSKIDSASRPEGIRNKPREISMGSGKMYGLVVVPRECNRHVQNACYWHRGGCESNQLCLPSGPRNRRCICGQRGPHQPPKQVAEQCRDYD